jgi:uncharacterized protein YbjT (DUF2867 family)
MENLIPLIRLVRRTGLAIVPGPGTVKTSYISIRDIAETVRLVLAHPPAGRSVIEFGGPDDLSMLDCVALMEEALGHRVRVCHIPLGLLRFVGRVARPFAHAPDALFEILEFVERRGLRADKSFLAEFPIGLTSFRSFVKEQLGRAPGA